MKNLLLLFTTLFIYTWAFAQDISISSDKYKWRNFDRNDDQSIQLQNYESPNLRPNQSQDKLVLFAASGGGLRAAAYTVGILLELEKVSKISEPNKIAEENVANEIDFFSTTSGGSWGVGTFIAYRYVKVNALDTYSSYNAFEERLLNIVDRKLEKYQFGYLFGGLLPWANLNERSSSTMVNRLNMGYLCYGYLRELGERRGLKKDDVEVIKLEDVFILKGGGIPKLPMQIANTTNTSNLSLVPFTPDILHVWGVKQYPLTARYEGYEPKDGRKVLEMNELLKVPLAVGLKSSGSVPGLVGATILPAKRNNTDYYLHLQDGGIVDNIGIHTIKTILRQTKMDFPNRENKIVIVADAARSGLDLELPDESTLKRLATVFNIASTAAPDAQYSLIRTEIQELGEQYDCNVIYLGLEALVNPKLGTNTSIPFNFRELTKRQAEKRILELDKLSKKYPDYFENNCSFQDRMILYEYVRTYLKTWFSAKGTVNSGKRIVKPEKVKGYGKIMVLAGQAVVQLNKKQIRNAMSY